MIFVSMTKDYLLKHTEQYQIHYSSLPSRNAAGSSATAGREDPRSLSSRASLYPRAHPPRSSEFHSATQARREYYASWSPPHGLTNPSTAIGAPDDAEELGIDAEIDPYINFDPPTTTHLPSPPPFTVITDCDDKSGDEEEETSAAILADRYRRDHLAVPYSSSDEDGGLGRLVNRHHRIMGPPGNGMRRNRRRATPSRIEPWPTADGSEAQGRYHTPDPSEEQREYLRPSSAILAPHARFFIQRERSMVSLKFDPPV